MFQRTDDLRITQVRPLLPPAILLEEIPVTERASNIVAGTRRAIADVLEGRDPRLVAIVGPCSIHDPSGGAGVCATAAAAARALSERADRRDAHLLREAADVGRLEGADQRSRLDESYHINKGLRLARQLLLDVNDLGLPTASEFLDTQIPQHLADLTSWVAIGARTTESQVHRELASGSVDAGGLQEQHRRDDADGGGCGAVGALAAPVSVGDEAGRLGDFRDDRQRHLPRDPARRHAHRAELRSPSTCSRPAASCTRGACASR